MTKHRRPAKFWQVTQLAQTGVPTHVIARVVGSTVNSVNVMISQGRAAGINIPYADKSDRQHKASGKRRVVVVPQDIMDDLERHAEPRGVTVYQLAREILATAVSENMVDAILDDGVTNERRDDHARRPTTR